MSILKRFLPVFLGLVLTVGTALAAETEESLVKQGMKQFQAKDLAAAEATFDKAMQAHPDNPLVYYFLGEIQLQKDNIQAAVRHWRKYVAMDPKGAADKEVPRKLTLLSSTLREKELKELLAMEDKISKEPPTPNTIAVFPLTNSGDSKFDVLSKGLTAIMITDLAKVPGVKVLERQKMSKLMEEMDLVKSGLTEDKQIRASRLLKAEKVVTGNFSIK